MSVIEVGDTFNCDCGFSWKRGQSGSHNCGDGLRKQIAELQQNLDAVLAEIVDIREQAANVYAAGYNQGHLNTVDGCAYAATVKDNFYHNALQVMLEVETPATDALLNSLRAEGVDMFALYLAETAIKEGTDLTGWKSTASNEACDYAAQLRAETDTTESLEGGK